MPRSSFCTPSVHALAGDRTHKPALSGHIAALALLVVETAQPSAAVLPQKTDCMAASLARHAAVPLTELPLSVALPLYDELL